MKERYTRILARLGHFQAQLFLTLMFVFLLTPYALLLRLFGQARLPEGTWHDTEEKRTDLPSLRRMF